MTNDETWLEQFDRFTPEETAWWLDELIQSPGSYAGAELVLALATLLKRQATT